MISINGENSLDTEIEDADKLSNTLSIYLRRFACQSESANFNLTDY
ncbi:hypothetical protein [Nostoc sp. ChiSLP03a]|nr:hypothetical protein [Nostoc sp. ChiSLP03a]MDZ8214925.1 hypothetical protein [Nostoc sp. ChiSLP03a]